MVMSCIPPVYILYNDIPSYILKNISIIVATIYIVPQNSENNLVNILMTLLMMFPIL